MFITLKLHWLGRKMMIHDPDELIYDIAWKSKEEETRLPFTFPNNRVYLLLKKKSRLIDMTPFVK